ncbi:MAG: DPP IV N-terminal domain-containing protein [Gemmatimonadota bacterium]|nr:DPP IV N-terminal domain-containing protein [Gemmatimonadota bacterium]
MKRIAVLPLLALAACESREHPSACADIPQVTVYAGDTAAVAACFADPDGDELVYSATSSNPSVATASVWDTTVTVGALRPGSASVTVTATDPGGLEGKLSFSVSVPNRAPQPIGAMPSIVVPVGQTRTVDASSYFTDPDGETLEYGAMSSNPAVVTASAEGSIVTVTVVAAGNATVTVIARDWEELAATQDFMVAALERLTNDTASDYSPAWSPDGTKIAFYSYRDGNSEIYVMDADGGNQTRLTYNDAGDRDPAWSPDGTKIAFASNRDDSWEIYVMDADGGNRTRLTNDTFLDLGPEWSPDGTRIAFSSSRYPIIRNIYVMDADGSNQTRLPSDNLDDSPAWSPDGTKIAFVSRTDPFFDIHVMDADGANRTRLTNDTVPPVSGAPAWSPDGTRIAFSSYRDDSVDIYVMDADGSNRTRLTHNDAGYWDWDLAWSPDGTKIAFASNRDGSTDIYVIWIK